MIEWWQAVQQLHSVDGLSSHSLVELVEDYGGGYLTVKVPVYWKRGEDGPRVPIYSYDVED